MGLRRRTIDSGEMAQREPATAGPNPTAHRETWVSTNKILNSSQAKRMNSRNPNFDYDETKLLIQLWGDPTVQKTLITTHKKHPVIAELARKMREHGYNRSTEEINTRIKNLKCFYNRIKKDMAAGIINQTTWKHFAEMDEIISRPVFGNAHRMHMLQQQKQQEEQEDLKLQILEQQEQMQRRMPVKLEVMSDDDSTEIRAEDLLTIDTNPPQDDAGCGALEKDELHIKEDEKQFDEDDEDDYSDDSDFDVENEFNDGLDELLSKAKAAAGTPAADSTSTAPSSTAQISPKTTTPSTVSAAPTSVSITTVTSSAGKISVVPTNLLLKPPTSTVNLNSPIQIYTQPTVSLAGSTTITGIPQTSIASSIASTANGMAPMKLILVNTVSKDGTTKQILTPASEVPTMPQMRPAPMLAPKPTPIPIAPKPATVNVSTINVPLRPPTMTPIIATASSMAAGAKPKHSGFLNGEKSSGFKTLLNQMVTIQRENLAVSRARLALDKERLEFEKQIGGPLVDVVRNLSGFFNGFLQQFQHQQQLQQKLANGTKRNSEAAESTTATVPAKKRRTTGSVEAVEASVTTSEAVKAEVISDNDN